MKDMTIRRACAACGGTLSGILPEDLSLRQIVIDSRAVTTGDLFAAFRGERVDGHDYIASAFEHGAACCLAEYVPEGETRPLIIVPNVLDALEKLSAAYREQFDVPVIGITGSVALPHSEDRGKPQQSDRNSHDAVETGAGASGGSD